MKIGIIGGSGLDDPDILKDAVEKRVETKFGAADLSVGKIGDQEIFLIARHGRSHELSPGGVNYRANIAALKDMGAEGLLATTACGRAASGRSSKRPSPSTPGPSPSPPRATR